MPAPRRRLRAGWPATPAAPGLPDDRPAGIGQRGHRQHGPPARIDADPALVASPSRPPDRAAGSARPASRPVPASSRPGAAFRRPYRPADWPARSSRRPSRPSPPGRRAWRKSARHPQAADPAPASPGRAGRTAALRAGPRTRTPAGTAGSRGPARPAAQRHRAARQAGPATGQAPRRQLARADRARQPQRPFRRDLVAVRIVERPVVEVHRDSAPAPAMIRRPDRAAGRARRPSRRRRRILWTSRVNFAPPSARSWVSLQRAERHAACRASMSGRRYRPVRDCRRRDRRPRPWHQETPPSRRVRWRAPLPRRTAGAARAAAPLLAPRNAAPLVASRTAAVATHCQSDTPFSRNRAA